ncbi:MAG: NADAR family protein, partial [Planctomycetota bacterium]
MRRASVRLPAPAQRCGRRVPGDRVVTLNEGNPPGAQDERRALHAVSVRPFSQWQEADFILDEIEYGCAEQYMMAEKARLFGDEYALELILDSDDPAHQKQVGRQIENFSVSEWED